MFDDGGLTYAERAVIRQYFISRDVNSPSIHNGFPLRRWASGPNKGRPKLPHAVQAMHSRGVIWFDESETPLVARFTRNGLLALKRSAADPRAFEHKFYWNLHDELAEVLDER